MPVNPVVEQKEEFKPMGVRNELCNRGNEFSGSHRKVAAETALDFTLRTATRYSPEDTCYQTNESYSRSNLLISTNAEQISMYAVETYFDRCLHH